MSDLLIALNTLSGLHLNSLHELYTGSNRINNQGVAFELFIRDIFSNSLNVKDQEIRENLYQSTFSYFGNQNNPPDLILKNGDAIEIKKIESNSTIALNSSYPKQKLKITDSRITNACKNCEDSTWQEKDILYIIGKINKKSKKIEVIWFLYGDCYAASAEVYEKILDSMKSGIYDLQDIELIPTNEIAKVNKVDPLGITDFRVRGMWHIKNPIHVFESVYNEYSNTKTTIVCLMPEIKFKTFLQSSQSLILENKKINIKDVEIKSPDNPVKKIKAKLINFLVQ